MPAYVWKNCEDHSLLRPAKAMIFDTVNGTPRYQMAMCPHAICCGQDSDCVDVATASDYDMKVVLPNTPFADDDCGHCDNRGGTYYLTWDSDYFWSYMDETDTCRCTNGFDRTVYFRMLAWVQCWCTPLDPNLPDHKCTGALIIGYWHTFAGGGWVQTWQYRHHPARNCRTSWTMPFETKTDICSGVRPCLPNTYPSSLDMELVAA